MTHTTEIKRRPDGSIDTAFYMARGRQLRSEQAHTMLQPAAPIEKPRSITEALLALFGRDTARA